MITATKVGVFREGKEYPSVVRTQYMFINKFHFKMIQTMKNKNVLDQLSAAHELAAMTLKETDRVFYRQRRTIEDQIGLTHGVIGGV